MKSSQNTQPKDYLPKMYENTQAQKMIRIQVIESSLCKGKQNHTLQNTIIFFLFHFCCLTQTMLIFNLLITFDSLSNLSFRY